MNPLWFQQSNYSDVRRCYTPSESWVAGFILNRRRLGALQCHSGPDLAALHEGYTFNVPPNDKLSNNR